MNHQIINWVQIYFILFLSCFALSFLQIFFYGINSIAYGDHFTYASIARSIVNNGTISHIAALPSDIVSLGIFPLYDQNQNFGLSLYFVPFFIIFGANNLSIIIASTTLYALNSILVYYIAIRIFDIRAAVISTLFFIFSTAYYSYINSGLSEPLIIFLLLNIIYFQIISINKYRHFIIGIFLGALYYTKSAVVIFLVPYFIVFYFIYRERTNFYFLLILGLLLTLIPILIRNFYIDTNFVSSKSDLIDLVFNIDRATWYDNLRSLYLPPEWGDPIYYVVNNFGVYLKRYAETISLLFLKFHTWSGIFFSSIFFYFYLFMRSKNNLEKKFKLILILIFFVFLCGFSIGWPIARYLLPTVPIFYIATGGFLTNSNSFIFRHKISIYLIVLITLTSWSALLAKDLIKQNTMNDFTILGNFVKEKTSEDDIIISNTTSFIGWYADRRTVLYPTYVSDLDILFETNNNVRALVLTSDISKVYRSIKGQSEWDEIFNTHPEKIGDLLCFDDILILNDKTYKALLYKRC